MAKSVISLENQLTKEDVFRSAKNALLFASPLLILALTELQAGKSFEDIYKLLLAAVINIVIDLLRKFKNESKYVK